MSSRLTVQKFPELSRHEVLRALTSEIRTTRAVFEHNVMSDSGDTLTVRIVESVQEGIPLDKHLKRLSDVGGDNLSTTDMLLEARRADDSVDKFQFAGSGVAVQF